MPADACLVASLAQTRRCKTLAARDDAELLAMVPPEGGKTPLPAPKAHLDVHQKWHHKPE